MALQSEQSAHKDLVGGEATALHKHKLNALDPPDGVVDLNKQQATTVVIENRTDDPSSPVGGQIWLRTDL